METTENKIENASRPIADAVDAAMNKAKETAGAVSDKAVEMASNTAKKADQMAASAGRGLESMADGIRQHAPSGVLGDASNQIASTLRSSGEYLEEHGVTGLADEVTELIRRNPIPAIFVALGIGFVLARATSARS